MPNLKADTIAISERMARDDERLLRHPYDRIKHDQMTAWACANAILVYLREPAALFGEWRDATEGYGQDHVDPIMAVNKIRHWRGAGAVKIDGYPR